VSDTLAAAIVQAVTAYVGAGCLAAAPLVLAGIPRLDGAAREATWGFRVIIVPGVVLLWPWLVARLIGGATMPPVERNAHRRAASGAAR
jgi:hypothetical protein